MEIIIKDGVLYHGNEAVADIAWRSDVWASRIEEIERQLGGRISTAWRQGVEDARRGRQAKKAAKRQRKRAKR